MTDNRTDRPVTLPSRPRPAPAPGRRDPMDSAPAATAPEVERADTSGLPSSASLSRPVSSASSRAESAGYRRTAEPLVAMNFRTTVEIRDLLEGASNRHQLTLRAAFERAVRETWG